MHPGKDPPLQNMPETSLGAPSLKKTMTLRLERKLEGTSSNSFFASLIASSESVAPSGVRLFMALVIAPLSKPLAAVLLIGTFTTAPEAKVTMPSLSPLPSD